MNSLTKGLFGISLAGIAISLGMTIYVGVKQHEEKTRPVPLTIPVPATLGQD